MQFEINQNPLGIGVICLKHFFFEQIKQCIKGSGIADVISTIIFFFGLAFLLYVCT